MDVTFTTAALAALCNSERRLAQRWGPDRGRVVARRLLEIAASDLECVELLPGASVTWDGQGDIVFSFGDEILICGTIRTPSKSRGASRAAAGHIVITSIDVDGSKPR
jgi:hypothetical protein